MPMDDLNNFAWAINEIVREENTGAPSPEG